MTAELDHADVEREPRAQAGLLEDLCERAATKVRLVPASVRLERGGQIEEMLELPRVEIADRYEMAHARYDGH